MKKTRVEKGTKAKNKRDEEKRGERVRDSREKAERDDKHWRHESQKSDDERD